ncbi:MAG: histidinol-phosphatase [Bacteroidales bacterium]
MAAIKGNYHTHSLFSDGKAPLADYVEEAISQGLHYLGFSEHSPLPFPNTFALKEGEIDEYVREVRKLRKAGFCYTASLQGQIAPVVFAGLEMDYIPGLSEGFAQTKQQYHLDFIIGSVHLVLNEGADGLWFIDGPARQIYDDGLEYYFGGDTRRAVTAYYRQLQRMIQNESFDIVGHLDKIKMHNQDRFFTEDEKWYTDLVNETLEEIACKKLIVEVNTRGVYKKRCESLFPGISVLQEIKSRNIPVMISSDAHEPHELSMLFGETSDLLKSIGFDAVRILTEKGWSDASL